MALRNVVVYFVTIVKLFPESICVGIEYYDDKIFPEDHTEGFVQIPYTKVTNASIWGHNVTHYSNTSNMAVKYDIRRNHLFYSTIIDRKINTSSVNFTIKDDFSIPTIKTLLLETLKEYEYIYDEDTKPYILRNNLPQSKEDTAINSSDSDMKTSLTEFYNLEPAVQLMDFNVKHNDTKFYSVWYVVEGLACWELPILYGEFGKQKKTSEVFLMHDGKLKNVVETNNTKEWKETYETYSTIIPLTYYTNKWCKTAPCYGDHTLCLFPDRYMSGICNEGYKVEVPNILEQTALVNTLNSMRNKIANGESDRYSHLPPAANMNQIIYDYDLEHFARVWLLQCLPGPEPCSSLDGTFVNQLECTKFAKFCCLKSLPAQVKKCVPKPECFTSPMIGCLHVWFWNAGDNLTYTDVQCGHTSVLSYSTAQLLWATTGKIGCAYGKNTNGDVRVVCNFSPGAPYVLNTRLHCGILNLKGGTKVVREKNITDSKFLKSFLITIDHVIEKNESKANDIIKLQDSKLQFNEETNVFWGIQILRKIYTDSRIRKELKDYTNGTRDMIARLVVKYTFIDLNGAKCDSDEPIYMIGRPGSLCMERGRRYHSLCYNFRNPTPGYRAVAIIAPIALFSLILYDLFSGVVRQTNY